MKKSELAQHLLYLDEKIEIAVRDLSMDLSSLFIPTSVKDNERVDLEGRAHRVMIDFVIASRINTAWKKSYDGCKRQLDEIVSEFGGEPSGTAGETVPMFHSNEFQFSKRQNVDGKSTLVVDLITELTRAGVEKSVLDAAILKATKVKRGNVYYDVTTVED